MNELKTTKHLVQNILETDLQARNSDSFLYFRVLEHHGNMKGVDIHSMSIPTFLLTMSDYGFPGFETVRRTRQMVQAKHPELAPNDRVKAWRSDLETEFRDYAREDKQEGCAHA